ncbi:MAG: DNA recombination protein RmuC [Phycisphaeraceae bacterium]|nr:DNA recombination protein RmuC [Phycisphaeraceae bacterium]
MPQIILLVIVILLLVVLLALVWSLRSARGPDAASAQLEARLLAFEQVQERSERASRDEAAKSREESAAAARSLREELAGALRSIHDTLQQSVASISTLQKNQLESFSVQLSKQTEANQLSATQGRTEMAASLKAFTDSTLQRMVEMTSRQQQQFDAFSQRLSNLIQSNEQKLEAVRQTVEQKLAALQEDNAKKLEAMRQTVDEKLQGTLEKRLGESFKTVGEHLEKVQRGLGEMQVLATGVGDLKKVLSNVKVRGTFAEVQLEKLLEQIFPIEQYAKNIPTIKGSSERVEFAIKFPNPEGDGAPLWMPIDAKFPVEDYHRLVEATEKVDLEGIEAAVKGLELRVKASARDIDEKYLHPPDTTPFGIMFLPTEGLYAEVLRRPGLLESIQREHHVVIAGPTNLIALLTSFQAGFRTLAIQKQSNEVWKLLGAVKAEFGKFGDILDKVQRKLAGASNEVEDAARKSRTIERKLRSVEVLPTGEAQQLLGEELASSEALDAREEDA